MLDATEHEFGENGFHAASVASITRRAGVAQGTFYLYFGSKEDAMRDLVRHMGATLRQTLDRAITGAGDRLQVERRGFEAFVRFALEHRNLYRVVMESQFVDEEVYRDDYRELAAAYAASLGLAPALVRTVFKALAQVREEGVTVVLVEQNVQQSMRFADQAIVLETGEVRRRGSGEELLRDPAVREAYLSL